MASKSATEVAHDLSPFLRVYKDGRVQRLKGTEIVPPSLDPRTGVHSKDVVITPATGVSARVYLPKTTTTTNNPDHKLPLILYFHGGGFFVHSPFTPRYHNFLNSVSGQADAIVVSVNYRKAPEHPLPIAYDDSWAAVKWVAGGGDGEDWLKEFVDLNRVFLAGDSAGANIAHNIAMRVGSGNLDGLRLQRIVLLHPYFWGKDPIGGESVDVIRKERIDKWWLYACPSSSGSDDPWINPGADPKLSTLGCTRVLVCVAENDVFRARGWYYEQALVKCGWGGQTETMESEGEEHVFFLDKPDSENTVDLIKRVVSFVRV